jgi:hypothetical protein
MATSRYVQHGLRAAAFRMGAATWRAPKQFFLGLANLTAALFNGLKHAHQTIEFPNAEGIVVVDVP